MSGLTVSPMERLVSGAWLVPIMADRLHGDESPAAVDETTITGFLLRSEVVSGWPGLIVDAYADHAKKKPLESLRMERLASGVLLCLIEGELARIEIHQKPETMHFGLTANTTNGFFKGLRDANGADLPDKKVELNNTHWRSDSCTLKVALFAESIKNERPFPSPLTSAQYGLQMIEGVEQIVFLRKV